MNVKDFNEALEQASNYNETLVQPGEKPFARPTTYVTIEESRKIVAGRDRMLAVYRDRLIVALNCIKYGAWAERVTKEYDERAIAALKGE